MKRSVVVLCLSVALGLAACGSAPSSAASDAARGRQIFETGGASGVPCATCHSLDGTQIVGPSLKGISQRAGSRVPGQSAQEYIRQSIVNPSAYIVNGFSDAMYKKYGQALSAQDIDDLVAFLMTQ